MTKRKTTEQYKREVYALVGDEYRVIGEYVNNSTKILMLHVPYGHTFLMDPSHFLRGQRCPRERNMRIGKSESLSMHEIKARIYDRLGDSYQVVSKRVVNHKLKVKHLKCGYVWETSLFHIMNDTGCPKCSGNMHKNTDIFKQEVYDLVGDEYTVEGSYINAKTKIKLKHRFCGNTFEVTPDNFLRGSRCPFEKGIRISQKESMGLSQFKARVKELYGDSYEILSNYKNNRTKIKVKHKKCGNIFLIAPNHILSGEGCPYCKSSKGEISVMYVLKEYYGMKETEDFYHGYVLQNKLHLDFYLPSFDLAIEYDGAQHYRPVDWFGGKASFDKQKKRDKLKDQYCKDHGIKLIRIPYTVTTVKQIKEILSKYIPV